MNFNFALAFYVKALASMNGAPSGFTFLKAAQDAGCAK